MFGASLSEPCVGPLQPVPEDKAKLTVQLRQTIGEHQVCRQPMNVLRLDVLLNASDCQQKPLFLERRVLTNRSIIQGLTVRGVFVDQQRCSLMRPRVC